MLTFIKGMALGGALCAAALVGYAYGSDDGDQAPVKAGNCQVRVGYPQYSGGYRCMFDQVMVGTQGNLLLCADVEVTCPQTP